MPDDSTLTATQRDGLVDIDVRRSNVHCHYCLEPPYAMEAACQLREAANGIEPSTGELPVTDHHILRVEIVSRKKDVVRIRVIKPSAPQGSKERDRRDLTCVAAEKAADQLEGAAKAAGDR